MDEDLERWFRGSALVEEDGTPMVLYHGSASPFPLEQIRVGIFGAHFGDRATAEIRARQKQVAQGGIAVVQAAVVALRNPLRLKDHHAWDPLDVVSEMIRSRMVQEKVLLDRMMSLRQDITDRLGGLNPTLRRVSAWLRPDVLGREVAIPLIRELGHDGIVYQNDFEGFGGDSWIVLDSDQVRDASRSDVQAWLASRSAAPAPRA